jgi:mannose-1-phosphate guanylyltransferase
VLKQVSDPKEYGIAVLDDGHQIIKFLEKPSSREVFSKIANTGTYVFEPEIFDYITSQKGEMDFSKDIFPQLIDERAGIYGFVFEGYWNDVGRPETYLKANYDVLNKKIGPEPPGKRLEEGVGRLGNIWLGEDVEVHETARLVGPLVIDNDSVIEQGSEVGKNTVLGKNVHLEKNSSVKGSVIFSDSEIGTNSFLKDCIVDSGCKIEKGSFIEKGAILGGSVHLGPFCRVHSKRLISNRIKILPESIIDSNYPIVTNNTTRI